MYFYCFLDVSAADRNTLLMALKPTRNALAKSTITMLHTAPFPLLLELLLGEGEAGQFPLHLGKKGEQDNGGQSCPLRMPGNWRRSGATIRCIRPLLPDQVIVDGVLRDLASPEARYTNPPKGLVPAAKKQRLDLSLERDSWVRGCMAALARRDSQPKAFRGVPRGSPSQGPSWTRAWQCSLPRRLHRRPLQEIRGQKVFFIPFP